MHAPASPIAFRPALTGLRAVAVWLVVFGHWTHAPFPLGAVGRITFFVLSGYLISGIIWKQQLHPGAPGPWWRRMSKFYQRRMLRILPPYYLALAVGALLPLATLREYPGWFVLPVSNLLFYRLQHWGEGVGHYWTMAIDEQFYLVWPLLLGLTGRRTGALLGVAAAALGFRVLWSAWVGPGFVFVLLPSCFDMFAVGAVLRLVEFRPWVRRLSRGRWVVTAWLAWAGLWAATHLVDAHTLWLLVYTTVGSGAAFVTLGWVLHRPEVDQAHGSNFLLSPLLQWVGLRSYGCYLYHLLLPVFYQRAVFHIFPQAAARQFWLGPLPTLVVLLPLLLMLAGASWTLLEAPLNRLKNKLQYASA